MDHSTALAELLARYAFRRHPLSRNNVGHLQLVGQLQDRPVDILLDTGAASTVVDLGYCTPAKMCGDASKPSNKAVIPTKPDALEEKPIF